LQKFLLKKKIQKRGGFSLFELLIYIAVLSAIVVVISNILISLSRSNGQSQARSEVNSSIRFANELLRQDIKNASIITTPASGTSSSSLNLTRNGVVISYDVLNGVLRRTEDGVLSSVTNSNISVDNLNFTRIENTNTEFSKTNISIKVNMTFRYNSTSPDWVYSTSLGNTVSLY
jgi:type II secretory pathway component PulJ